MGDRQRALIEELLSGTDVAIDGDRPWDLQVRNLRTFAYHLQARLSNRQNKRRAFVPAEVHYDLGNDLFEGTFDTRLTGSCGSNLSSGGDTSIRVWRSGSLRRSDPLSISSPR